MRTLTPVGCGTSHDAEFVGVWKAPDRPYPRGVRCYLWLSDRTVTASLAGAGPAGLPVRTR